jgi:glycosyltransferase involved in cell wall biosynthesis
VEGLPIIRNPGTRQLRALFGEADAVFGNHLSLRLLRPLLLRPRKPHCILLHTHLSNRVPNRWLSGLLLRRGHTYAVSNALAKAHELPEKVIYNGFDASLFHLAEPGPRKFDFLFVGRLVSDKGIDLLMDAMRQLPPCYSCMVVGDGPDRERLEAEAPEQMKFLGRLDSPYIAELMRQSKWLVVPSRWKEPFGLVAIEAIACGARVLAANHGGLPEAVGPCGVLFRPNNAQSLMMSMRKVMERNDMTGFTEQERQTHLGKFSFDRQVDRILQVLHQ